MWSHSNETQGHRGNDLTRMLQWFHTSGMVSQASGKLTWWRHQMETFSALLAICAGNSPVSGEFPTQRPVTLSFDVYFDLRPNKRLSKQSWSWWFETLSRPFWRHRNDVWYNCLFRWTAKETPKFCITVFFVIWSSRAKYWLYLLTESVSMLWHYH